MLSDVLHAESIKNRNAEKQSKAADFKRLYQFQWAGIISRHVLRQKAQAKWNKTQAIPLTADIVKLNHHLSNKEAEVKREIQEGINPNNWRELCQVTLAQVVIFNRRRPGETQYLQQSEYLSQTSSEMAIHDEIYESLPLAQKVAVKRLTLIMTRGKRDRGVPIMLTPRMKDSIRILNKHRDNMGVMKANPYIFACPASQSLQPFRGHDCLRKYANQCGAENPTFLTATKLRKHLATCSQILNLTEGELEQLANHLGHNISVHREYYRLPQETIFLAKISKILLAADKGQLHKFQGQSLEQMDVDMNEGSESNDEDEEKSNPEKSDDIQQDVESQEEHNIHQENAQQLKKKRKGGTRVHWSKVEEDAVLNDPHMKTAIRAMHPPSHKICQIVKAKNPCLETRSISQIKSKVWNAIQKSKRHLQLPAQ